MKPEEYRGGITREQFLYYEVKVVAKLIQNGLNEEEVIEKIINDNLFQLPTEKSIKSIAIGCYKRLTTPQDVELIDIIANKPVEVSKQASLYLLMKYNRLVWEFMVEVIGEKYRTQDFSFNKNEVTRFLGKLQVNNEQVSDWSDTTMGKIRSVLIKILSDTGYLNDIRSNTLNYVYLYDEVAECIKNNGDREVLPAFNCFD